MTELYPLLRELHFWISRAALVVGVLMALETIGWDAGGPILAALVSGAVFYLFPSPGQQ